jgi:hypothetical protein
MLKTLCKALTLAVLLTSFGTGGCTEKKDLSPPPLNPHPKEAIRLRVEFDNPEDVKRYTVTMRGGYQNQQEECGYFDYVQGGHFVYPEDEFDIPNLSPSPEHAEFVVYLDRFNRATCNWEFAGPSIQIHDTATGWQASSDFGASKHLTAGTIFKETCQFMDERPNLCYSATPPPDVPHVSMVPITIHVAEDSAPLRPHQPGFFSNFVKPVGAEQPAPGESDPNQP